MTTVDKLREYIKTEWHAGNLRSGDRLPSLSVLAKICGASYVTTREAMSKLAWEGLVRVENGNGCYLALDDTLPVLLRFPYEMLLPEKMIRLIDTHLTSTGLCFSFECASIFTPRRECNKSAIIEIGGEPGLPCADLSDMSGYDEVLSALGKPANHYPGMDFPFVFSSFQMGVNTAFFRRAGVPIPKMTGNFSWWDKYVKGCRKAGITPASAIWNNNNLFGFNAFSGLVAALNEGAYRNTSAKWFSDVLGSKLFEVLFNVHFFNDNLIDLPDSFYTGKAGVDFHVGSWISVQNQASHRPDVQIPNLKMIAFSAGEQRLLPMAHSSLRVLLPEKYPTENRNRIWELIRIMLSKKFRLEFCNESGQISEGADISPEDYAWYQPEWKGFFPQPSDICFSDDLFFPPTTISALSMAIELWKFASADSKSTRRHMDAKLQNILRKEQFYNFSKETKS